MPSYALAETQVNHNLVMCCFQSEGSFWSCLSAVLSSASSVNANIYNVIHLKKNTKQQTSTNNGNTPIRPNWIHIHLAIDQQKNLCNKSCLLCLPYEQHNNYSKGSNHKCLKYIQQHESNLNISSINLVALQFKKKLS